MGFHTRPPGFLAAFLGCVVTLLCYTSVHGGVDYDVDMACPSDVGWAVGVKINCTCGVIPGAGYSIEGMFARWLDADGNPLTVPDETLAYLILNFDAGDFFNSGGYTCEYGHRAYKPFDRTFWNPNVHYGPTSLEIGPPDPISNCPDSNRVFYCKYSIPTRSPAMTIEISMNTSDTASISKQNTLEDSGYVITNYLINPLVETTVHTITCSIKDAAIDYEHEIMFYVLHETKRDINPPVLRVNSEIIPLGSMVTLAETYNSETNVTCSTDEAEDIELECASYRDMATGPTGNAVILLRPVKDLHAQNCSCLYRSTTVCGSSSTYLSMNVFFGPNTVEIGPEETKNFSLCPSDDSLLELECTYEIASVNPGVNISISGVPGIPEDPSDVITENGFSSSIYQFRPSSGGIFEAVCRGRNRFSGNDVNDTKSIQVFELPANAPALKINDVLVSDAEIKNVALDETVSIHCSVEGGYPDVTSVSLDCPDLTNVQSSTGKETSLTMTVEKGHHGLRCVCSYHHVADCIQNITTSFEFNVQYPPEITSFTVDDKSTDTIEIELDERVEFVCSVEGNPRPSLNILFERDNALENLDGASSSPDGIFGNTAMASKVMGCGESGKYKCVASTESSSDDVIEERHIWVKCNVELVRSRDESMQGPIFNIELIVSIYPDPTSFQMFKVFPEGDLADSNRNRKRRAAAVNSYPDTFMRREIPHAEFSAIFTRTSPQLCKITVDWVDIEDVDELFYELLVFNGLDDEGSRLAFNVSRRQVAAVSTSSKQSTDSNASSLIAIIVTSIIIILLIVIAFIIYALIFRKDAKNAKAVKIMKSRRAVIKAQMKNRRTWRAANENAAAAAAASQHYMHRASQRMWY